MQIPELEFEIPPEAQRGSLSTVPDFVDTVDAIKLLKEIRFFFFLVRTHPHFENYIEKNLMFISTYISAGRNFALY